MYESFNMGKIKETFEKVNTFLKSNEGQKIKKAAARAGKQFLGESGLGQKALDYLDKQASQYTKESPLLDHLRQFSHYYGSTQFGDLQQPLRDTPQEDIRMKPTMSLGKGMKRANPNKSPKSPRRYR